MPAKTKSRSKAPAMAAPQSDEEARGLMSMIGAMERRLDAINAGMTEQVDFIRSEAERKADPIRKDLEASKRGLQAWAETHRQRLTDKGKRKFADLGTGKISWRLRPASVLIRGKEAVIEACRALGHTKFIRTKEDVNKEAMLADPKAAAAITGVTIKADVEDFIIEPVSAAVSQQTGEAA